MKIVVVRGDRKTMFLTELLLSFADRRARNPHGDRAPLP
jgi:hypothetical protein